MLVIIITLGRWRTCRHFVDSRVCQLINNDPYPAILKSHNYLVGIVYNHYYGKYDYAQPQELTERPTIAYCSKNIVARILSKFGFQNLQYDKNSLYIPVAEVENIIKQLEELYNKGININDLLETKLWAWKEIICILNFKGHEKRAGIWKGARTNKIIEIDALPIYNFGLENIKEQIEIVKDIIRHEMQHLGQDLLKLLLQTKSYPGIPPKKVSPGAVLPRTHKKSTLYGPREHGLKDIEFQTDLMDEVSKLKRYFNSENFKKMNASDKQTMEIVKKFVGLPSSILGLGIPAASQFFVLLRNKDKKKWHLAVKKLLKQLEED